MEEKAYIIFGIYGKCNKLTRKPMFACRTNIEADFFLIALKKHEQPYFNKVVEFFKEEYPCNEDNWIPENLDFELQEIEVLALFSTFINKD